MMNKLENIPQKKRKVFKPFNLDTYIDEHCEKFREEYRERCDTFTEKCEKEFKLLDLLIDSFVDIFHSNKNSPFTYSLNRQICLTELELEAIEMFQYYVETKGYSFSMMERRNPGYNSNYTITVK